MIKNFLLILTLAWGVMGYQVPVGIPNPADSMGFDPLNIPRPDPAVKCTSWANGNPHAIALGDDCDCYYVDNDAHKRINDLEAEVKILKSTGEESK